MPVVNIHAPIELSEQKIKGLLHAVRSIGAVALGSEPTNIWVLYHLESASSLGMDAEGARVLVKIAAKPGRSAETRTRFVTSIAHALTGALSTEGFEVKNEDIWIEYHELEPGMVWHRGQWS